MPAADDAPQAAEDRVLGNAQAAFLYGGVCAVSCAIILFEICVLRIFSVLFLHHFAFAIVSVAILGLGVGGIVISLCQRRRMTTGTFFARLSLLSNGFAALLILFITVASFLPTLHFMIYMLFLLVPFVIGGMVTSSAFAQVTGRLHGIYCFNLLGSAAGAVAVLALLDWVGGINAIVFTGVLSSLAALMFAAATASVRKMMLPAIVFLAFLGNFLVCVEKQYLPSMPIDLNTDKEIAQIEKKRSTKAHVVETRWSAFGRTDLVEFEDQPLDKNIYIDGSSGSPMFAWDGNLENVSRSDLERLNFTFLGAFPYHFLDASRKNNALILGSGGGRDVLVALVNGVKRITAVDVNTDLIDIVKRYARYNGGIYSSFRNVDVVAEEGRSFVRRTKAKYDLLILPLTILKTSRSAEGYLLMENYLYTTDAIEDYLSHLTPDGQLVFLFHGQAETYRLVSILLPVFEKMGLTVEQAMNRLYVVGTEEFTLVAVRNAPVDPNEMVRRFNLVTKLGAFSTGGKKSHVFFPYLTNPQLAAQVKGPTPFGVQDKLLLQLYTSCNLKGWLQALKYDTGLITDKRPFFDNLAGKPPQTLNILMMLSLCMLIAAVFLPPAVAFVHARWTARAIYGSRPKKKPNAAGTVDALFGLRHNWRFIMIFALLGAGFMLTEMVLLQKFILFLGQPVISLSILLLSLFIGMGAGGVSVKYLTRTKGHARIIVLIVLLVAVMWAYSWLLPGVFAKFLGSALWLRMLLSVGLIVPLGVLMGMPCPYALSVLRTTSRQAVIPWMWGVNGVSSVCGSLLAVAIGILVGFDWALAAGTAMYLAIIPCLDADEASRPLTLTKGAVAANLSDQRAAGSLSSNSKALPGV